MGIPLPLLSSPRGLAGGREEEEDFWGKKKKKKKEGQVGFLGGWVSFSSIQIRAGYFLWCSQTRIPLPGNPSPSTPEVIPWLCLLPPSTAHVGSNLVTWIFFFIWTQKHFQASLLIHPSIHPSIHSTESIKNLLCARYCPRCLGYDS